MINAQSTSYSTSCLRHIMLLSSRIHSPDSPPSKWLLLLSHLCGSSSASQLLAEGGARAGSLILLLLSIFIPLMPIQSHGFKYYIYADDPKFVSLAQTYSLNSSLIYPAVNSTFILGCVLTPHTLQSTARACSPVCHLGSYTEPHSQEGPRFGSMF